MAEEIKVTKGTKIEPEEAKNMDRTKMGVAISGPPQEEDVEGQYRYYGYTQCPWCGNIGRSVLETDYFLWYTCGACGGAFRAIG
jgi:hypothetical protein